MGCKLKLKSSFPKVRASMVCFNELAEFMQIRLFEWLNLHEFGQSTGGIAYFRAVVK